MEAFEKLSGEIDNEITSTTKANGEIEGGNDIGGLGSINCLYWG